ncbi:MAG: nucleotidyltransferase domain-containing protein, partial [Actinomycetota bacterium]
MEPTFTIADVYATPGRAKVLRTLARYEGPMSTRAVADGAGLSHTAAGSILRSLGAMGMVRKDSVGIAHAYTLERANVYVRDMVLPAIEAERSIIDELCRDLVADFAEHCQSLVLFGSYAYGEQTETSDIDVFALVEDSRRAQLLERRNLDRWSWYSSKYSSPLSLIIFTRAQASDSLGWNQSALRTELASTGIILHGLGVDEWGLDCDGGTNSQGVARTGEAVSG